MLPVYLDRIIDVPVVGVTIFVRITFHCGACDAFEVVDYRTIPNSALPITPLPPGWRRIEDTLVCPAHTVTIVDKAQA